MLSQSEWVKFFLCADGGSEMLASVSEIWEYDNKVVWILDGSVWIQHGRISGMAAIIKLSENEWVWSLVWVRLCKMEWIQGVMAVSELARWLPSSSWVRMNEGLKFLSQSFVQNGWIQDGWIQYGRIQDGCLHQVKWEWMSLSQIELVLSQSQIGVRVFLSESERR